MEEQKATDILKDIADAVREKTGISEKLTLDDIIAIIPYMGSGRSAMIDVMEGTAKVAVVPNGVSFLGKRAFQDSPELEEVYIPGSVKAIDAYAFRNCKKLKRVKMAEGIESVGAYTVLRDGGGPTVNCSNNGFYWVDYNHRHDYDFEIPYAGGMPFFGSFMNCVSLKEIEFSDSVRHIGEGCLVGCEGLERIKLPPMLGPTIYAYTEAYPHKVYPAGDIRTCNVLFRNTPNLKEITIPAAHPDSKYPTDLCLDNSLALEKIVSHNDLRLYGEHIYAPRLEDIYVDGLLTIWQESPSGDSLLSGSMPRLKNIYVTGDHVDIFNHVSSYHPYQDFDVFPPPIQNTSWDLEEYVRDADSVYFVSGAYPYYDTSTGAPHSELARRITEDGVYDIGGLQINVHLNSELPEQA